MDAGERREDRRLEVLDHVPWGDVDHDLDDTTEIMERMKKAARGGLWLWEGEGEERYGDEFSVSDAQLEAMSDQMRLAYFARLGMTLVSRLGANTHDGVVPRSTILGIVGELRRAA